MLRIYTIARGNEEILVVDYIGLREAEMIETLTQLKEQILLNNRPVLVMSVFNDKTYITPAFMRHAEKETAEAIHLLEKSVFVGLSITKKIILRGYNFFFRRSFRAFDTQQEAIEYLLNKDTSDKKYIA